LKDIEPKILTKDELERFSSGVSAEDILEFDKYSLNEYIEPLVIIEAKEPGSAWVKACDKEGNFKEILDATSMNWTLNLGFAHPDVCYAVYEQMKRLTHVRYNTLTPVRAKLVKKLAEMAPGKLKGGRVSLNCEGGGLAIEAAIKLALISSKGADHFGVFWGAYHGNTLVTGCASHPVHDARFVNMGYEHFTRIPYPYCYRCMWNYSEGIHGKKDPHCKLECFEVVKEYILGMAPKKFAGIIIEPIQAGGGQLPAPPEWLRKLKEICEKEKVFLIYDECQTCAWRTGKYFTVSECYEKELGIDVSPDMIAYTKGIAGGFPLGVLIASPDLKKRFGPSEEHTTFSSSPLGMCASLAAIEVMERQKIGENCEKMGQKITKRLKEMQEDCEVIGDVRGPGLFIGVEMVKNKDTREHYTELSEKMVSIAPDHGIYLGKSIQITPKKGETPRRNVIMIKPPLILTDEECEYLLERFEIVLKKALKSIS